MPRNVRRLGLRVCRFVLKNGDKNGCCFGRNAPSSEQQAAMEVYEQGNKKAPAIGRGAGKGQRTDQGVLERIVARFAGANTDDFGELGDKDLAIADLAGLRGLDDQIGDPSRVGISDDDGH